MESALYGIFTLVGFVSEISLVRCAHSFDFRYFTNSCENPVQSAFHEVISGYIIIDISYFQLNVAVDPPKILSVTNHAFAL